MELGQRIRSAREAAGLSQEELGAAVGRDKKTVRNWENGHTNPRSVMGRLEAVLGVNLRDDPDRRSTSPRLDEATDAQLIASLAARLAERNDRIRELTAALTEHNVPDGSRRWAARVRRADDDE